MCFCFVFICLRMLDDIATPFSNNFLTNTRKLIFFIRIYVRIFSCSLIDMNLYEMRNENTYIDKLKYLENFKPLCICIRLNTHVQMNFASFGLCFILITDLKGCCFICRVVKNRMHYLWLCFFMYIRASPWYPWAIYLHITNTHGHTHLHKSWENLWQRKILFV